MEFQNVQNTYFYFLPFKSAISAVSSAVSVSVRILDTVGTLCGGIGADIVGYMAESSGLILRIL